MRRRHALILAGMTAFAGAQRAHGEDFDPTAWLSARRLGRLTTRTPQSDRTLAPTDAINMDAWNAERAHYEAALWELLGRWPVDRPPLESRILGREAFPDWTRFKVSFQSLPSNSTAASTIFAWLFVPRSGPQRKPALITAHQTVAQGKDEPAGVKATVPWMRFAEHYAGRGYVTLAPDMIGYGERTTGGFAATNCEWRDAAPILERQDQLSLLGLMLFDLSRSIDYLETLNFVDAARIGVIGHSQGGFLANFLLAIEPRVAAGVASCGYGLFRTDKLFPDRWAAKDSAYLPRLALYRDDASALPLDFHHVLALAAPKPHLIQTALGDTIWTLPAVAEDDFVVEQIRRVRTLYGPQAVEDFVAIQPASGATDRDHGWYPEGQAAAENLLDRTLRPSE